MLVIMGQKPIEKMFTVAPHFEVGTFELIVKESKSFKVIYSSCGGQSASFIFCLPLVRNIISYQFGLDEILLSFI